MNKINFKQTEIGGIPKKWQESRVGDHIELAYGDGLPERVRKNGLVPVFGSNGITGFHDKALINGPGIIIGRKGTVGQVVFSKTDFWPIDTTYYVKIKGDDDIVFWYYFLSTLGLNQMNSHSAVPGLNRDNVYEIVASLPPLFEQRAIAKILSDLDEKIELNHQMNKTLESICQAIFKRWFVGFEFLDERGKPYKSSGGKMVDSELGEIPKGWSIQNIYHIANVIYGAPFASGLFNTKAIGKPLIRIRDLTKETPEIFTCENHPKGYLVRPGDIVVGMDGEFRAHLWGGIESWLNQRICVFAPKIGFSTAFVLNSIAEPLAEVERTETATTVIHLGKNDIDKFKIMVPNQQVLNLFNKLAEPLYAEIVRRKRETSGLAVLRDSLLPRLMSGRIRVGVN